MLAVFAGQHTERSSCAGSLALPGLFSESVGEWSQWTSNESTHDVESKQMLLDVPQVGVRELYPAAE